MKTIKAVTPILIILLILLLFAFMIKLFIGVGTQQLNPGEDIFLRDQVLLYDISESMAGKDEKASENLFIRFLDEEISPADKLICYRIDEKFKESDDFLFKTSSLLKGIPRNIAETEDTTLLKEEFKKILRKRWEYFLKERSRWEKEIRAQSKIVAKKSDYLGALENVGKRFKTLYDEFNDQDFIPKRQLIVFGDLIQDPKFNSLEELSSSINEYFIDVEIIMLYPGGTYSSKEQRKIEDYWKKYFETRGNSVPTFITFDTFIDWFPNSKIKRLTFNE